MLKLCTSSWNVSGRRPLLPPSNGVERRPGCLFLWMLYLSRFYVCVLLKAGPTELYISTDPDGLGPLYQPRSLTLQQHEGRGTFQEVQSLKNKQKKI